jgi:hypothetical protein
MHFLQVINSDISVLIVCNKTGGTIKGDIKKMFGPTNLPRTNLLHSVSHVRSKQALFYLTPLDPSSITVRGTVSTVMRYACCTASVTVQ